ncbi:hypothetical protein RFI_39805 [Reticulomyxa filosa]|uniref:Uncharacterized protein n=1 Tax=Reticulomyxa filosa TaxID=46433 RepID=X6L8A9_RETFI|nr:hypothetical protein RFI_39805 [Reticulomyxa filosa]|eukprot:ETN97720.1 hypothetical protein RFI_39805 [Reticulomyxa filosa]
MIELMKLLNQKKRFADWNHCWERVLSHKEQQKFVEMYLNAYKDRVQKDNPEFMISVESKSQYLRILFDVLGRNWSNSKVMADLIDQMLNDFVIMDVENLNDNIISRLKSEEKHESVAMAFRYILKFIDETGTWSQSLANL